MSFSEAEIDTAMIVNWALAELGLAPDFSIAEETARGRNAAIFWRRTVAHTFGLHDWTFARLTTRLPRLASAPDTGYTYGFELPGNRLGEPVKLLSDPRRETPVRDFRIESDILSTDEPDVWATCKYEREPARWDPAFVNAFAVALAGYLSVPLLQDADMAAEKLAAAFGTRSEGGTGGLFGRLIAQNRAAGPIASPMVSDALLGGRLPTSWHGG